MFAFALNLILATSLWLFVVAASSQPQLASVQQQQQQSNSGASQQQQQQLLQPQQAAQQTSRASNNNNNMQAAVIHENVAQNVSQHHQKGARYKTMYACEDRLLTIDCDFGSKINLIRANYGRFSITQCNDQGNLEMATDCMSPITFRIMQDRCQDKQKCSINATSSIFGDKCPKTRKYLEVHFQCQPDSRVLAGELERVDLRQLSSTTSTTTTQQPHLVYPSFAPPPPPVQQQQQQQRAIGSQQKPMTVMNSEIMSYQMLYGQPAPVGQLAEPIQVSLKHVHVDNVSNPRCVLWDPLLQQWTERGSRLIDSNQTHTTCAFEQASSYLLVMDHHTTQDVSSTQPQPQFQQQQQQQQSVSFVHEFTRALAAPPGSTLATSHEANNVHIQIPPTQPQQPQRFTPIQQQQQAFPVQTNPISFVPYPDLLNQQPEVLPSDANRVLQQQQQQQQSLFNTQSQQQQQQQNSPMSRFLSVFGYLLAFVCIAIALLTVLFVASAMRSSAGAAFKSLSQFAPSLGGSKYAGHGSHRRRASSSAALGGSTLHNKDLLVINSHSGHQFLYAPAQSTKINGSASTHMLAQHQSGDTLHQVLHQQQQQLGQQQQPMYSGANGTLSNLSGTGGQSNNYYYGLMGFNSLFQQQQQQQQAQQQQQMQIGQQQMHFHQANKSQTMSSESANSTPSSSGVESGTASVHAMQQQCLVMTNNTDYNMMLSNFNQQQQQQQPTLTLNAHYAASGAAMSMPPQQQQQMHQHREHIYECVDDDKPYMARLLMPVSSQQQQQEQQQQQVFGNLGAHTMRAPAHQQQPSPRALTMSRNLAAMQQQQQQPNKRLFAQQPTIVRDQIQAKTNIICSTMTPQVTPQRATELLASGAQQNNNNLAKFQHDVMAIYNGNSDTTTTTTTTAASSTSNQNACYSQQALFGKLSTDC